MNIEKADDNTVSCISLRWLVSLDGSEAVDPLMCVLYIYSI